MPDKIDANGLTIKSYTEIRDELEQAFKNIYGNDIILDQNSPDGQLINIFTQASTDYRELIKRVYNSFDPDSAIGIVLDNRCAINNITRKAGTYTIVPIDVTVNKTVTLKGLDADYNNPQGSGFTVQDNVGNQYILIDSITIPSGTHTLNFRAQKMGGITSVSGSINTMTTVVLGVTSVINNSAPIEVGEEEESDAELRLRRQRSVAINARSTVESLQSNLLALDGVTNVAVHENDTNNWVKTIPPHSIWVIVQGGSEEDIARVLYERKDAGCGMKGDISYQVNNDFIAYFDRPNVIDLYIKFNIKKDNPSIAIDEESIKEYIENNLKYKIAQTAYTTPIIELAQKAVDEMGGEAYVLDLYISMDGTNWTDYIETPTLKDVWGISKIRIDITVE